jgi:uncharacterized protein with HEPN domain
MSKGEEVFIKHILESIRLVENYTRGLSKKRFLELIEKRSRTYLWNCGKSILRCRGVESLE